MNLWSYLGLNKKIHKILHMYKIENSSTEDIGEDFTDSTLEEIKENTSQIQYLYISLSKIYEDLLNEYPDLNETFLKENIQKPLLYLELNLLKETDIINGYYYDKGKIERIFKIK